MIRTFLRPNLIKRFNIRRNCDLKCKDRCINLIRNQSESLCKIADYTHTLLIINIANMVSPIIYFGAIFIYNLIK
jgi:hypothetical protein